jgi:predicted dehydrogenase
MCNPCTITRVHTIEPYVTVKGEYKKMLGIAIIGCGYMSNWHVNGWRSIDEAKILATVDIDEQRAKERAVPHKADHYQDYRDLFRRKDIKAVSVTLPHHVRADIVCDLLEHGLHVLLEKPVALNFEEARRIHEAAEKKGRVVMVAENWRYNPVTKEAQNIINSGEIGDPFQAYAHMEFTEFFRPHQMEWHADKAKSGGGVLIDSGIHIISVLRMLMGEFETVSAFPGKQVWQDISPCEDNINLNFRFASGATGVSSLSWRGLRKHFHSPFTILGTKGILEFNFQGGIHPTHLINLSFGPDKQKVVEVKSSESMGIQEQTQAFVDGIIYNKKIETTVREEMKSVAVALAAYKSIEKKAWVDVPRVPF